MRKLGVSNAPQNIKRISEGAGSLDGAGVPPSEQAVFKKNQEEDRDQQVARSVLTVKKSSYGGRKKPENGFRIVLHGHFYPMVENNWAFVGVLGMFSRTYRLTEVSSK